MSRVMYRDTEEHYNDGEDEESQAASWLPGTARKAIRSVMWDRSAIDSSRRVDEAPVAYDRNSVWRSLQRRERAIVQDVQHFLQIQEDVLTSVHVQSGDDGHENSSGSATPTSASASSSRRLHRSILEPATRPGPGGEIIPVRQPRRKKAGVSDARKGIAASIAELANLKVEEDASILSALSTRKQALAKLRRLSTKHDDIAGELTALETDEAEPLAKELEELGSEHRGICSEIEDLQKRLTELRTRRRHLESRIDGVKNRREAGLSGYRNALKEVEDTTSTFLARPPVKPLDMEALAAGTNTEEPMPAAGGIEFMRLRPERRTIDMAREWWESEVSILERRKAQVDIERVALEDGGRIWEEVVRLVVDFETELRKLMSGITASVHGGGVEDGGLPPKDTILKLQQEQINNVVTGLEQQLHVAETNGWNLLIAAIGAELEAFRQAQKINRDMLKESGIGIDDPAPVVVRSDVPRETSGVSASTSNSFHTVNGGSANLQELQEQLLDLPNNREDERTDESDNEVPADLIQEGANDNHVLEREASDNEVPPEFLVEHDSRS
jgi:myosin heavy subunit